MDIRNILGKLDQLSEGTMASAKKKPTGPKFVGKMKGTDPASAAKSKYVGGESILRDLEAKLNEEPEKRDLMKEFREFKEARAATAAFRAGNNKRAALNAMSDAERRAYDKEQQEKQRKRDDARLERERQKLAAKKGVGEGLNEFAPAGGGGNIPRGPKTPKRGPWDDSGEDPYQLRRYNRSADFFDQFDSDGVDKQKFDKATGEYEGYYFDRDAASGITQIAYFKFDDPTKIGDNDPGVGWYYEPVDESLAEGFTDLELAVMEGGHELVKENPVAPAQPGKPTLGADLTKPQSQQDAEQQQQDQKAQQLAAQKEKQEQATLQKGVNDLKSAGAAVSNPAQVVKAFDKAEDNQGLTPADKNSIASAGTVLAPIMANPALQGKFKDLVTQASAAQKKEQQQQANQAQASGGAQGTAVNSRPSTPAPAGQVK